MIKKVFVGMLLGGVAIGVLYLYFLFAGNPSILRDRIYIHQLYSAILFASIVLLYTLQGSSRIFNFLIFIIILIDAFILGDAFFRNNIGLNNIQFITLFGLILVAIAISYITHRIRFLFMAIVGLGIIFVLLTGILPLYQTMPSLNDFIQAQKSKIINQGVTEGTLYIKNALGTKEIPLNQLNENDIDLSQKTQISFASKTKTGLEKVFIDLGNGAFININPQSAVTVEQSGNQTVMQILQGNIEYYTPPEISGALQLIGKYKGKSIEDIQNTIRSNLSNQFEEKKQDFFINQLGGTLVLNTTIDKVIRFFINTLYSISPKTYQENLNNYNNIQTYLGKSITGSINKGFTGENIRSMIDDLMSQVKKGAGETTINKRLQ